MLSCKTWTHREQQSMYKVYVQCQLPMSTSPARLRPCVEAMPRFLQFAQLSNIHSLICIYSGSVKGHVGRGGARPSDTLSGWKRDWLHASGAIITGDTSTAQKHRYSPIYSVILPLTAAYSKSTSSPLFFTFIKMCTQCPVLKGQSLIWG